MNIQEQSKARQERAKAILQHSNPQVLDEFTFLVPSQFDSVQFKLSDSKLEQAKAWLLADATKNARSKAESMAKAAGLKLGKVRMISESSYGVTPLYFGAKALSAAESAPTQIQPGGVEVSAYVSVVYEI